jgi:demethylmenaquinone methyltransferase/2-methoxy-6-polyprenyl-1,4-benzoquinol methylase
MAPATDVFKSPARIAGMFDAIAARYDFLNHLLSAGIDKRWRKAAIRSLQLSGRERVLDLCTGTADVAIAARSATPCAARVVGVDFAASMLRVGQNKLRQEGLSDGVTLVRGDAACVPAATGSVDAVTIAFGIRNVEQTTEACAEMHRVLRPGGRLAVLEFAIPANRLVRRVYLWYFNHVLPWIGRIVARHQAYEYLPASVGAFHTPEQFVGLLRGAGFHDIQAKALTLGVVYLYTAKRR